MTIYNFAMLNVPFANGAISTEIAPFPDWNRGLGIAFEQSEGKPEMKGLNGLFQVLTTSVLYLKQRGIAEWDSTLEYPANAFVTEGAKLYKSKRTNTGKQPSLSQLDWDVWASISDISVSTNGNLKKTVATDGSMTLEVPTATDIQRGAARFATATEVANKSNVGAAVTPRNISDMFVGGFSSANDGVELPNGLTIKWGYHDPVTNIGSIAFKTPFKNNIIFGMCNLAYNQRITTMAYYSPANSDRTKLGFVVTSSDTMDTDKLPFNWLAIGY